MSDAGSSRAPARCAGEISRERRQVGLAPLAAGRRGLRGPGARARLRRQRRHARHAGRGPRARRAGRRVAPTELVVHGVGLRGLQEPAGVIDVSNSGTLLRLLPGLLAGQPEGTYTLDGDASIRRRPVDRIADAAERGWAPPSPPTDGCAPMTIDGGNPLTGITYELPVASAQVKSCVLLAGLLAEGETTVVEPRRRPATTPSGCCAPPACASTAARAAVTVWPRRARSRLRRDRGARRHLVGRVLHRRRDAGARVAPVPARRRRQPGPRRPADGAGADGRADRPLQPPHDRGRRADRRHRGAATPSWSRREVEPEIVPSLIDELPLIALAACSRARHDDVRGAEDLRKKESDRIATVAEALQRGGARVEATDDGWRDPRRPGAPPRRHRRPARRPPDRDDGRDRRPLLGAGRRACATRPCIDVSFPGLPRHPAGARGGRRGARVMVVTIDGPAGAGKSPSPAALAQRIGYRYLDTGAMYRAVTLCVLHRRRRSGRGGARRAPGARTRATRGCARRRSTRRCPPWRSSRRCGRRCARRSAPFLAERRRRRRGPRHRRRRVAAGRAEGVARRRPEHPRAAAAARPARAGARPPRQRADAVAHDAVRVDTSRLSVEPRSSTRCRGSSRSDAELRRAGRRLPRSCRPSTCGSWRA